ncbi:hypothetical protein [Spiroplasma endosymbiont of Dilophus febrilis]|uniref:hypothetical protein n=1 Tax=Spiroplasma endosymbiont of Dilophus febrilis TaxID=3066292 RepID=UPI00313AE155
MLFFQNYSNLYPPNKTLCAQVQIYMLKINKFLISIFLIFITTTPLISCSSYSVSEEYLQIDNKDIFVKVGDFSKLQDIVDEYLYFLVPRPGCNPAYSHRWNWNIENRFELKGTTTCGNLEVGSWDWTIFIRKNKEQKLFVYKFDEYFIEDHKGF